ncbi:MAG TPA: 3'-5' exonuclease, partial [Gallionella sp.]|nr:3'-5' exonuclease [Gallionella sp.]
RGRKRAPLFEQDAAQQAREEMNLLYVAMTRAQQALIVSGNSKGKDKEENKKALSWYDRIAAAVGEQQNPLHKAAPASEEEKQGDEKEVALPAIIPTGKRATRNTAQQQRGIWLHSLLQHLTEYSPDETTSHSTKPVNGQVAGYRPQAGEGQGERAALQQRLAIPSTEMESLWQQAQHLVAAPQLARFFDAQQYRSACNEMPYVNALGEMRRIDRLVEFGDEVWVLDYKLGDSEDAARYRTQMEEYRGAMQTVYAGRTVRCALLFADGVLSEV